MMKLKFCEASDLEKRARETKGDIQRQTFNRGIERGPSETERDMQRKREGGDEGRMIRERKKDCIMELRGRKL